MSYFNPLNSKENTKNINTTASLTAHSGDDASSEAKRLLALYHSRGISNIFQPTKELALEHAEQLLEKWLPEGELQGSEYVAYNPLRYDNELGSFKININTGLWSDFATDDKGGDLISLVTYLEKSEKQLDGAIKILEFFAKQRPDDGKASPVTKHKADRETTPEAQWAAVMPIPQELRKPPSFSSTPARTHAATWEYKDAQGNTLFYVLRFDTDTGKSFLPLVLAQSASGKREWKHFAPPVPRPPYGLDRLAAHPEAYVIFAEGEKAADAAQKLFPEMVAVTTMNGSKSPEKSDFSQFKGRKVFIAPDNDEAGNSYKDKLIKLLHDHQAEVIGVLQLPKLSKDGKELSKGYDLADALADGWTAENISAIKDLWTPISAPPAPAVEGTADRGKPTVIDHAKQFVASHYGGKVFAHNDQILAYDKGFWKPLEPNYEVKKRLVPIIGPKATPNSVNNAFEMIKILNASDPTTFDHRKPLMCLRNGTLNPLTRELLPHSPDHYLTNKLDIDYASDATCPLWLQTLDEIFAPDPDKPEKIQLLQEFVGYCLIPDTRLHQFLWLVGGGGNGKSLILNIVTALVGQENISYAPIEALDRSFVRAELQGKLVNISSEMSAEATITDSFLKQVTAGDTIQAERKFEKPFSFRPYARLIGATNTLPRLLDHSDGFTRRALILRFNRQFKEAEKDPQREARLLSELPGILVWAIAGLTALLERGHYVAPTSTKDELAQYKVNSDPVQQFAGDHLCATEEKALWIPSSTLYDYYKDWALTNGYQRLNTAQFSERLLNVGIQKYRSGEGRFWKASYRYSHHSTVTPSSIQTQYIV